jgi:uncharacterized glyoxalase superfamily protein PhnB
MNADPSSCFDRFDHLFVQPGSFEASLAFYRDTLGWAVEYAWGGAGQPRGASLRSGAMRIVIAEDHPTDDHAKSHGIRGRQPTVHLQVDDVAARYAAIGASGRALFAPERTHWGTLWFVAEDPDGNLIAFEQKAP